MRIFISAVITLTFGLVCVSVVHSDTPSALVVNGGFEAWLAAPMTLQRPLDCPRLPTGWNVSVAAPLPAYVIACDANVKHEGSDSIRLSNTDSKSSLTITQRVPVAAEYRYIVSLWLKGDHIDAYHPNGVVVHAEASTQGDVTDGNVWSGGLKLVELGPSPNSGTFDWHECRFAFDAPKGTKSLMLFFELRGAGTVWFDDVRLTPLEKSIEVETY